MKINFGEFLLRAFFILFVAGSLIMGIMMANENEHKPLEIRNINGCEYIVNIVRGGEVLTHKGDCKNIIHKK